ncbi:MAG: 5-methyltetrahydropteroyltriglutamate--homocysteine S-methyltransferase [Candidatus Binatus sp.]|uniref:5-methyltetrahydropteroyltriglutamate-- homocysteine S-methyltransferase n=1 Tax=Candidatus Binatus sp. TaxID=2811406 RepID=UPI0027203B61|nr:5-methyltetrahydropteroyltriglutamate--homocysteine S-methyltransferase [Candidatus Binatus sp.]MDO8432622.1 5-methyltetrahydropteroyltriglutamate--homocysteine S-methyltransferase [Candidatus Binatus sp.]
MATSAPHNPPFRAEHVGSLLRPPELLKARAENEAGRLSAAELRKLEDDFIRKVVAFQEDVGLQSITDGEYRRGVFYTDFVCRGLGGASVYYEIDRMFFIDDKGSKIAVPLLKIHDRLRWQAPVHADEFKFTQSLTKRTVKMTLPSPTSVYSVDGGNVNREVYPDLALLRADVVDAYRKELPALAAAGCRYVQIDEVPIAMYCDPKRREQISRSGIDPNKVLFDVFPNLINDALADRPKSIHVAMHLCRGNNQSGWLTEGGYDPVAEMLFNQINVDSYLMEYDTERAGTFEPLRFVPKNKSVVLGIVSSKLPQLESKDALKRRIDQAAKYIDLDQLGLSPQCGFASTAPGNKLTPDQQKAKLQLVVEVAREVWG